jgi:hypothetical protein
MTWVFDHSPYDGKAQMIHLILADHADESGVCWPNQVTIARKARCSVEYVRRVVKQMVADGFVGIMRESGGPGKPHVYLIKYPNSVGGGDGDTPTEVGGNTPTLDGNTPTLVPKNHHKNNHQTITNDPPAGFAEFWAAYPNPVGKAAALKAYRTALTKVSASTLIAAAHSYARSTAATERRFIKHPGTWLNGGFWDAHEPEVVPVAERPLFCPNCDTRWSDGHVCGVA